MSEIINAEYKEVMPARLTEIAAEINFYSANVLMNVIEIGRRFEEAKSLCPRGEWGKWCKNSTGYEQSMAENYMKVYREYGGGQLNLGGDFGNSQSLASLGVTKLLELTKVPAEDRETFVEENNITADTTVKELKEKIKQLTEEKEAVIHDTNDTIAGLEEAAQREAEKVEKLNARIEELEKQLDSSPAETDDSVFAEMIKEAEEKAREEFEKKIKELEGAKQKAESKVDDLNRKIKAEKEKASAAAESEKAMKEKYDAAQAELIKAKKAANASGNQELTKINILFGDIQNKIRELNEAFSVIGNAELEGKVKGVLSEQLKG